VFLETNYDEAMLEESAYPWFLKQRIRGGNGHLSNHQALGLFLNHRPDFMSHVFLSHLSENNNSPQLVQRLFAEQAGTVEIVLASRHYETAVYRISGDSVLRERPAIYLREAKVDQTSLV
jgi:phosphoribosyl 1,2-cyclic phosphodiesterase